MISELTLVPCRRRISIGATEKLESNEVYSSRDTEKGFTHEESSPDEWHLKVKFSSF